MKQKKFQRDCNRRAVRGWKDYRPVYDRGGFPLNERKDPNAQKTETFTTKAQHEAEERGGHTLQENRSQTAEHGFGDECELDGTICRAEVLASAGSIIQLAPL